jgi:hypothetical protein
MAATEFTFTPNEMTVMDEGIYSLQVVLTDFAGNVSTVTASLLSISMCMLPISLASLP